MYHFMEQTELSKLNAAMCKLLQFHFDDLNQNSCGYWKIIISILDITSVFFTLNQMHENTWLLLNIYAL